MLNIKQKDKKAIEKHLGCKFIRINPDEQNLNIFEAISKIQRNIKESSKKLYIDKISERLLILEFKSDHVIKLKCLKYFAKKILPSL